MKDFCHKHFPFTKFSQGDKASSHLRCHDLAYHLLSSKHAIKGDLSETIRELSDFLSDKSIL